MGVQTIIPPSGIEQPMEPYVYASVTARFLAMIVDWFFIFFLLLLLFIPLFLISLFGILIVAPLLALFHITLIPSFFFFLVFVHWIYFATMESSPLGATYGKRMFGIRVVTVKGDELTFSRASLRYFGKLLSAFPFLLGFVMAFVTTRKQALHDLVAETLVVRE
ncbi:MAG: RDD family protein [Bdellovibrionales bacterium]